MLCDLFRQLIPLRNGRPARCQTRHCPATLRNLNGNPSDRSQLIRSGRSMRMTTNCSSNQTQFACQERMEKMGQNRIRLKKLAKSRKSLKKLVLQSIPTSYFPRQTSRKKIGISRFCEAQKRQVHRKSHSALQIRLLRRYLLASTLITCSL